MTRARRHRARSIRMMRSVIVAFLDDDRSKALLRFEGVRLRRREIRDHYEKALAPYADVERVTDALDEHLERSSMIRLDSKRVFGLALAFPLAVMALTVQAAVTVSPKLGRLVLFCQERPGLHGKPFTMRKFRTKLPVSAELRLVDDEPCMTEFGQWPRPTSLDDLPTLLNVVEGHMSCVGPRPLLQQYIELHSVTEAPRHGVRPGLTQVTGRNTFVREQVSFGVDRRDLALDARILRDTVFAVANRNGINAEGGQTMSLFAGTPVPHESARSGRTAS